MKYIIENLLKRYEGLKDMKAHNEPGYYDDEEIILKVWNEIGFLANMDDDKKLNLALSYHSVYRCGEDLENFKLINIIIPIIRYIYTNLETYTVLDGRDIIKKLRNLNLKDLLEFANNHSRYEKDKVIIPDIYKKGEENNMLDSTLDNIDYDILYDLNDKHDIDIAAIMASFIAEYLTNEYKNNK